MKLNYDCVRDVLFLSAFKSVSIEIISQVATNVIYKKLGLI